MNRNLHAFFYLMKNFFEFVYFPRFKNPKMSLRKTKIWPKSSNCGFLWQFLRQIFSFDPEVYCPVNFMMVGLFFDEMAIFWIQKKKKIKKKLLKILFWKSRFIKPKNIFSVIFQEVKKTLNKKKRTSEKKNWIFFSNSKIFLFPQKESYHHKIHRQCTLGSKLKICWRICHKNQHLLIFDDFGKIWGFSRLIFGFFKSWEIDKLKKTYFSLGRKSDVDYDLSTHQNEK